ncbi:MAG: FHA domain-containing protein [SAR324 cluster bacterium]|nr:FHA domain-containing protein [SAR324 cluster bacterium]
MNWMKVNLRSLSWQTLLFGAAAGAWAAFLAEGAMVLAERSESDWATTYLPILVLGLVFGALFAPIEEWVNHYRSRIFTTALAGGALAAVAGTAGFGLAVYVTRLQLPSEGFVFHPIPLPVRWVWFALCLGLIAGGAGMGSGLGLGDLRKAVRRGLRGTLAGAVAAFPLAAASSYTGGSAWTIVLGCTIWGGLLGWLIFWLDQRTASRWLRLVLGSGEDRFYPLRKRRITLGKEERNDIPLLEGDEIYPRHCEIKWIHDHYEIIDDEQGGIVLVNFRQIQEHPLKAGDLVKIGSVLLQYGEGSRS